MRLLITTGIFPPDIGGPSTYVPQIARGLVERGHMLTVLTLSDRLDHDDSAYPFRVMRLLRAEPKALRIVRTVRAIRRLGRDANVLYVNGLAFEAVLANLALEKPLVLKVVGDLAWERATVRGWASETFEAFQTASHGPMVALLKTLRTWWTRRADQVIVPSRYLLHWVMRWGVPEDRITVIYNAAAPPDGLAAVPVPLATAVKLVTAGRLVPWKRLDGILEAMAEMKDVGLVVIGDGPEREGLESRLSALGLNRRVYFAGERAQRETFALMADCNVFVLNSTYEGLPHVLLEAMALGLPVIATAVGGTPELVRDGETGFLVPVDGGTLQLAVARLIDNAVLRRRLGQAGRRWVRERFGPERMVEQTEAVLFTVVKKIEGS